MRLVCPNCDAQYEVDAALIPDPGYQPYKGGVWLAGGDPVLIPLRAEEDFLIDLRGLPSDLVARSKILYLNYPNNPTAATAPALDPGPGSG